MTERWEWGRGNKTEREREIARRKMRSFLCRRPSFGRVLRGKQIRKCMRIACVFYISTKHLPATIRKWGGEVRKQKKEIKRQFENRDWWMDCVVHFRA